jgi:Ca-activated chloride channel family protein
MRFQVETDRPLIANDSATRYVLATIVAPEGAPRQRPPVNLGLVLDRSGSMGGEKIRLAKDAAVAAIRRLDSRDRFCVVTYDDLVEVVVPSTVATGEAVKDAVRAIMSIEARGSTDLCGGWLRCCEQVALAQAPDAVTRVLLLTDGLANHGVTDHMEIIGHAGELRRRGVSTTTIGVGEDFDEHLLGRMADEGGGHFYFVERDEQIPRAIETEVGESLEVTLRGARLSVRFAGCGTVSPITTYPVQKDSGGCVIELGDLVSLQEVTVAMRVSFDREAISGAVGCIVRLPMSLSGASAGQSWTDAVWTIASGPQVGAQPRNRSVDRAVAEAHASLARREAGRLNRDGDYAGARHQLTGVARRILRYAGDDSVLRGLVDDLQHDAVVHEAPMAALDRKARYMVSEQSLKGRDLRGAATRRPNRPGRPA